MPEIKLLNMEDVLYYQHEIASLLNECMIATYSEPVADSFIAEKLQSLKENMASERAYVFIAVEEKNILGFLWAYPLNTPINQRFHVAYISVTSHERRKGIGKLLLREAEKQAEKMGLNEVELIVSNLNVAAINFYQGCGYRTGKLILEKNISGIE